jgi:short-subunit dehydrogenase
MSPITKQTIAIIGSSSKAGTSIAKGLCKGNYRLLLFDDNCVEARLLSDEINKSVDGADVDFLECTYQASWEADIIFITMNTDTLKEISEKIVNVATQKTVAVVLESERKTDLKEVESHFPNSKVVGMISSKNKPGYIILISEHTSALNSIQEMLFQSDINTSLIEQTKYTGIQVQTPVV